jgi:hypothetical protein
VSLSEIELLREAIKLIVVEKDLSKSELAKHGGERFDVMLQMIKDGKPFELSKRIGGQIVISPSTALIKALISHDGIGLEAALKKTSYVDERGDEHVGLVLAKLEKTKEFGGKAATKDTRAHKNEAIVSDTINSVVASTGEPVTVVFGDRRFDNVVSAEHVGMQHVKGSSASGPSKPDVILHDIDGNVVKISIKMKRAHYYLSGDKQMAPILAPVFDALEDATPPDPRLRRKKQSDEWEIVAGSRNKPIKKNVKFSIDDETAKRAVFSVGDNSVDMILRGNLLSPNINGNTITWANATVDDTLDDIPEDEKPVGLLRHGAGRYARDTQGRVFKGIRPAVATKQRTASAIEVPT